MAQIHLFFISSIKENELNVDIFFPSEFRDQNTLAEILKIKKHFKKCGDGCLQTKDYIYHYRTFISLSKKDQNLFLIFYCSNSYKENNIDKLCEEIFPILDDDPIEEMQFKKSTKSAINEVFLKYQHLDGNINKISTNIFGNEQKNIKKSVNESSDDRSDISSSRGYIHKRCDPRFYSFNTHKEPSENDSDLFSDSNAFKTCSFEEDSGLSVVKKFNENINNENFEKWKKVKKNYLIFSIILSVVTYFLFPLLLRLLFN